MSESFWVLNGLVVGLFDSSLFPGLKGTSTPKGFQHSTPKPGYLSWICSRNLEEKTIPKKHHKVSHNPLDWCVSKQDTYKEGPVKQA